MNPLKQLEACGQSPWLDYLKRSLIANGELRNLIERDGLKGVTSNPSIFEKAIGESDEYADALKQFQSDGDHSVAEIYEHLAIADIRAAADVLRPVYDQTRGRDGYVSLECSPYLANDTEATIAEALRLWAAVDRANLMVKVPATPGRHSRHPPADRPRASTSTSPCCSPSSVYEQVAEAYIAGLEDLARPAAMSRGSAASPAFSSAASIRRSTSGSTSSPTRRRRTGCAARSAIANAKIAYERYKDLFSGPRWQALAAAGAKPQRLLWASTSTKNPAYRDTLYVEALIGRDTVNTMPPATMDAFRDHGQVVPDAIEQDLERRPRDARRPGAAGISLEEVTANWSTTACGNSPTRSTSCSPRSRAAPSAARTATAPVSRSSSARRSCRRPSMRKWRLWRKDGRIRRLWAGDKSLWTGTDEDKWLGWLDIVEQELADIDRLQRLRRRR